MQIVVDGWLPADVDREDFTIFFKKEFGIENIICPTKESVLAVASEARKAKLTVKLDLGKRIHKK